MQDHFSRTKLLLGEDALKKLAASRVAVFGIGGVGSYVVEALTRAGVGQLDLIDNDTIAASNINRQIIALSDNIGKKKIDAAKERCLSINPSLIVRTYQVFVLPDTVQQFDFSAYDYVVDVIDTVTGKLAIIENAAKCSTPVISSMGTGNKLDPTAFEVADIYETSVCPLAKVMRKELRARNIDHLKVVYSKEVPIVPMKEEDADARTPDTSSQRSSRRQTPGSISFVPSVAGLIIAGEVVKDLLGINRPV